MWSWDLVDSMSASACNAGNMSVKARSDVSRSSAAVVPKDFPVVLSAVPVVVSCARAYRVRLRFGILMAVVRD